MKFGTLIPFRLWVGATASGIAYALFGFEAGIIVGVVMLFALTR